VSGVRGGVCLFQSSSGPHLSLLNRQLHRCGERRTVTTVLVDTGAELSWFPAEVLESLNIQRRKIWHFRQADGTVLGRWVGGALVYAAGTSESDNVVFGEPRDLVLLGARSLEGLNVRIEPVSKRLVGASPARVAVAA
jgi:predicted aspartyl protease